MKKLLSLALALMMLLSLVSGALADDEVTTLRILVRTGDATKYQATIDALNDLLAASGLKVKLEWISHASSGYPDYVNGMLLDSPEEEVCDLLYVQGAAINPATLGAQDLLVDMTDMLAASKYAKAFYDADEVLQAQFNSCPYLIWPSHVNKVMQFRTDALEACASYAAFQAEPNAANYAALFDELVAQGYEGALTVQGVDYLFDCGIDGGFGINATWLRQEDGSYVYSRVSENFHEELKWWRERYVSGALHKNFATDDWETMENALYNGRVAGIAMKGAAYSAYYENGTVKNNGEAARLSILPPMKSVSGEQLYKIPTDRFDRGWVISTTCKDPQLAFDVLDFLFSDEARKLDLFGIKDQDYTLNEDGTYNLLVPSDETNTYRIYDADVFGNIDVKAITTGAAYWPECAFISADLVAQYGKVDNNFVIPEEYATSWTACESLWKEFATQYILGEKTDADWDAFVSTWNSYGGAQVAAYAATVIK
ncbi:MAG: hypothetical protein IKP40_08600 [Clostridia bacterium]|nr:hypothetical protein [Clostridia bacterium]